ncbi:MAG: hypothetical protein AAF653_11385 [Chloroflexota bacterium]
MGDVQRRLVVAVAFFVGFGAAVWAAYADPADTFRSTTGNTVFLVSWLVIIWYIVTERHRRQSGAGDDSE